LGVFNAMTKKLKDIVESIAHKYGDKLYKNVNDKDGGVNPNQTFDMSLNKGSDER